MPVTPGRRTPETTRVRWDTVLMLKRLAAGGALASAALTLGATAGGWFWLLAAVVAIPGGFTLTAVPRSFTAPCPACGQRLGASVVRVPDEPTLARTALDVRCPGCGIYVDCSEGEVREAPFNRAHEAPFYELTLDVKTLDSLDWGDRCAQCGRPATRGLQPSPDATFGALEKGAVPYCDRHGDGPSPEDRGLLIARHEDRVIVRVGLYATYRVIRDRSSA